MTKASKRVVAVIPARYGSTRFPAKVVANILGKPMIQWVYERVLGSELIDEVLVATDDDRVFKVVESFKGKAVMTSIDHQTGTDRIAEAIKGQQADLIVNVQGDEPMIPSDVLDQLVEEMLNHPEIEMGTVAVPVSIDSDCFNDPNVVKVVVGVDNNALYFSRAPIPFARGERPSSVKVMHHWGIYAYQPAFLRKFVGLEQSPLECCEKLEQLRALENGAKIFVLRSSKSTIGVDVPEDLTKVEAALSKEIHS